MKHAIMLKRLTVLLLVFSLVVGTQTGVSYASANASASSSSSAGVPSDMHPDKAYKAGKVLFDKKKWDKALPYFMVAVKGNPSAANLRITADTLANLRRYDEAVNYYLQAAAKYDKVDKQAAIALRNKASAITSIVELYLIKDKNLTKSANLAKYEPQNGMYFGAFVEYEPSMQGAAKGEFNSLTGVQHPIYFTYHHYGAPFPHIWAKNVKDAGAAIHLALEATGGLSTIKDDTYLRDFAKACAAAQMPIFIRLNSEMNGEWAPWHGDPKAYIETFRTVAKVMKQDAPNVAMVWTPNSVPTENISSYYPGDEYVDWVGVNLYSVSVFNGDPKQPAAQVNPLDLLDAVYKQYASKKPIQVSEYAATHYSAAEKKDTTAFAIAKMRLLYQGVKFKYPRVKSIHWYSANNLVKAHSPERRLNNFSILENGKLKQAYGAMLKDSYFLKQVVNGPNAPDESLTNRPVVSAFATGAKVSENVKIQGLIKTYDPYISKVVYKLDGQVLATTQNFPYAIDMPVGTLKVGKHKLEVVVFDSQARVATRKTIEFVHQ